jgi:hypothetical protein
MIIGFIGLVGSGKTEAAVIMESQILRSVIIPMAKPLKDTARNLGWNGKKDKKGRKFLTVLGTELLRECICEKWHTKRWKQLADETMRWNGTEYIIIDDVRFHTEVKMIQEMGGILIRINGRRDGKVPNWWSNFCYFFKRKHKSETELKNLETQYIINNSFDLTALRLQIEYIKKELLR